MLQRADRHDARAVLVAQRQQEQQILHGVMPSFASFPASDSPTPRSVVTGRSSDDSAARCAGRRRFDRHSSSTTQSISTCAPRGSAATPTAARAGYGSLKYSAMILLSSGEVAEVE